MKKLLYLFLALVIVSVSGQTIWASINDGSTRAAFYKHHNHHNGGHDGNDSTVTDSARHHQKDSTFNAWKDWSDKHHHADSVATDSTKKNHDGDSTICDSTKKHHGWWKNDTTAQHHRHGWIENDSTESDTVVADTTAHRHHHGFKNGNDSINNKHMWGHHHNGEVTTEEGTGETIEETVEGTETENTEAPAQKGQATGIRQATVATAAQKFDINGRKVNNLNHGQLYIVGGRKVLNK